MKKTFLLLGLLMTLGSASVLCAQQTGYFQTNLVSNTAGVATTTDTQLLNPWGISILPGQDFWVANNNGGTSTLYDPQGNKNALVVTIPGATKNPNGNCSPGCPTGTVANGNGSYFGGGSFIFDTEDGIIANWTGASSAVVAFDNSASGAVYKGLALLNSTFLLAANFNSGKIDVYDHNFQPTSLSGSARCCQTRCPARLRLGAGGYLRHDGKVREYFGLRGQTQRALGSGVSSGELRSIRELDLGGKFWRWHYQRIQSHNRRVYGPAHRLFEQRAGESRLVGYGIWRRWSVR